jgi:hypothetical protein
MVQETRSRRILIRSGTDEGGSLAGNVSAMGLIERLVFLRQGISLVNEAVFSIARLVRMNLVLSFDLMSLSIAKSDLGNGVSGEHYEHGKPRM